MALRAGGTTVEDEAEGGKTVKFKSGNESGSRRAVACPESILHQG